MLVSCLMVVLPREARLPHLHASIAGYCRQTHSNRELVIVFDQGPAEIKAAIVAHVSALARDDVRIVDPPEKLSLGALRNLSRDAAHGEIWCQWDDDDLHHPQRIERQLRAVMESGSAAVCLEEAMQLFPETRRLYCTNWRATEAKGLPPTLLCKRSAPFRYPETGSNSQCGEDLDAVLQLQQAGGFLALSGAPHLYVYMSHGDNTWSREHHLMLARRLGLSKGLLRRRESALREGLAPFDFGPGEVIVEGYNGTAFMLERHASAGARD